MRNHQDKRSLVSVWAFCATATLSAATSALLGCPFHSTTGAAAVLLEFLYPAGVWIAAIPVATVFRRTDMPIRTLFLTAAAVYGTILAATVLAASGFPAGHATRTVLADMTGRSACLGAVSLVMYAAVRYIGTKRRT